MCYLLSFLYSHLNKLDLIQCLFQTDICVDNVSDKSLKGMPKQFTARCLVN